MTQTTGTRKNAECRRMDETLRGVLIAGLQDL